MVHSKSVNGKVRQEVLGTQGQVDVLQKTGQIDGLLASGRWFATRASLLDAHRRGKTPAAESNRIGAPIVLKRLFEDRDWRLELDRLRGDLDNPQEFIARNPGETYTIRSQTLGNAGKALQALGVALGSTAWMLEADNA